GLVSGTSQQPYYDSLHQMMRSKVGVSKQPSPVRLSGPVPLSHLVWVIQAIVPEASSVVLGDNGELLRLSATITLVEYVEADVLVPVSSPSPAKRLNDQTAAAGGAPTSARTYTLKFGDTLWGIAQRELGAGKRYTEIAELNGIRDPNRVPVGTVLKLP